MKELSNSKLRKIEGITAFYAEIIRYIAANDVTPGTTITGIPGHSEARYAQSKKEWRVTCNNDARIEFTFTAGGRTIGIDTPDNYLCTRGGGVTTPTPKPTPTPTPAATPAAANSDALGALSALLEAQKEVGRQEAEAAFKARENELIEQIKSLKENTGAGTVINVTVDDKTRRTETEKVLDDKFEFILELLAEGENVYLYGPAGSGKNVLCEEAAKALGIPFYYQNTILTKFDLSGYKNAGGEFEETEFYKAWTKGGLFMLDEIDNSTAEALVALNAALANGYFTFPGVGKVEKHKDFRCIAAGNTNGQGATDEYCGRYKMDESSRDRFAFVEIDYNEKVEKAITKIHPDVLEFVHELRQAAKELHLPLVCGYRALGKLCKHYEKDTKTILNAYILRGMQNDDINELKVYIKGNNKFAKALRNY